jgi:hypothetical protein
VIEAGLTDPEHFHNLAGPLKNKWSRDFDTHDTFCGLLRARMEKDGVNFCVGNRMYLSMLQTIYVRFCKTNIELSVKAKRRGAKHSQWMLKEMRHNILLAAYARTGRCAIQRMLVLGECSLPAMIEELTLLIEDEDILRLQRNEAENGERASQLDTRQLGGNVQPRPARRRIMWTEDETSLLVSLVNMEYKWCQIAKELPLRSDVDCKDRYRNILRPRETQQQGNQTLARQSRQAEAMIATGTEAAGAEGSEGTEGSEGAEKATFDPSSLLMPKSRRKRKAWTLEEDALLMRMRGENRSWVAIAVCLCGRTNVDCKDRYRNINNK